MRRLREKGLLTEGLQSPRRRADGTVAGRDSLYASLNRDVLCLYRKGLAAEAEALAGQARRIERSAAMKELSSALAAAQRSQPADPIAAWQQVARSHGPSLEKAVRQIERARNQYVHRGQLDQRYFGWVVFLSDSLAQLETSEGQNLAVPIQELATASLDAVGKAVLVSVEHLGDGQSLFQVEPALVIDGPDDDQPDGLPPGVSLLDLSRIQLPDGKTLEELLPAATIPAPIAFS